MTSLTFVNSNHRKYNNVLVFQPFRVFSTFYNFNLFKVTESKYISKLILSLYNPFGFNRDEKKNSCYESFKNQLLQFYHRDVGDIKLVTG